MSMSLRSVIEKYGESVTYSSREYATADVLAALDRSGTSSYTKKTS
jgi:hypothetical protein